MLRPRASSSAWFELAGQYCHTGFFIVRSPLLPFGELSAWGVPSLPEGPGANDYAARRARQARELQQHFERPELREALLLASPRLEKRLAGWLREPRPESQLEHTLVRYFTRMSSRETPFGAFAGISLGHVGEHTRLLLSGRERYVRRTRVGMGHLVRRLAQHAHDPSVRDKLLYEPNSTLHFAFGRWRFAFSDPTADPGAGVTSPVVEATRTAHLDAALARAFASPATVAEIAAHVDAPAPARPATLAFVRALVDHGVLMPAWGLALTGPEPFERAYRALELAGLSGEAKRLEAACAQLAELNRAPLGAAVAGLRALGDELAPAGALDKPGQLFHADLIKPSVELSLGRDVVEQLLRAAELVQRTSSLPVDARLDRFRARFIARYGDRFVPLGEAIDGDLGIGFESTQSRADDILLDGLPLQGESDRAEVGPTSEFDRLRLGLLTHALQAGERVIDLAGTLDQFPSRGHGTLPESFAVVAQLASTGGGMQVVAPTLVAPSGIMMVARFCHADPQIEQAVRRHVELEQGVAGNRILADVSHLPDGHAANILLRPVLRSHELVYGGTSGAGAEAQIPISDLYVGVVGQRIVLRSKRLGRDISVRITNAHNFDAWWQLPVYRFLGALQEGERGGLAVRWSWGSLARSRFLPRVVVGDVVLCRTRWTLARTDLEPVLSAEPAHAFVLVQGLRSRLALPRWLVRLDHEQPLTIDLDNALSVEAFLHESRSAVQVTLEEMLPAPDQLCLNGPEGVFVSEIVLPLVRRPEPVPAARSERRPRPTVVAEWPTPALRSLFPGSEFLYAKIFTGASMLPRVLESVVPPLRRAQLETECRWFFLPHSDPDPHLRLRIHSDPRRLFEQLLPDLLRELAPFRESGAVWRLQLDTYERELERYGGPLGMDLAEELFWIDSEAVVALCAHTRGDATLRWQLAAVGIDRLLADLGLSLDERASLALRIRDGLRREFAVSVEIQRKIGAKYRTHAKRLTELLWASPEPAGGSAAVGLELIRVRSQRLASVCERLAAGLGAGQILAARDSLASSFAHLHAVRALGLNARAQELILYDFLYRQYTSELIRATGAPARRESRPVPAKVSS